MYDFDLDRALAGHPVCTGDHSDVSNLTFEIGIGTPARLSGSVSAPMSSVCIDHKWDLAGRIISSTAVPAAYDLFMLAPISPAAIPVKILEPED